MSEVKTNRLIDIVCQNCGAPLSFDIRKQEYHCSACGSAVDIEEAKKQQKGFRKITADLLSSSLKDHDLISTSCSGCGAKLLFERNEALSTCMYCGKSLLRDAYLKVNNFPEALIPFAITLKEAKTILKKWCDENVGKKEAKQLLGHIDDLQGSYLPYELAYGPIGMKVSRMDRGSAYDLCGFINEAFVNCSKQFDNLLLDGMEPYDTNALKRFDFGYVAGQRVKISDIDGSALEDRTRKECESIYKPFVRKLMNTEAVNVNAGLMDAMSLPVLLPVYYFRHGDLMAAVNGQNGKVAVKSLETRHYYFLPWWLKAILATLAICLLTGFGLWFFGVDIKQSIVLAGILRFVMLIIMLCFYSDTSHNDFRVEAGKEIFTSDGRIFSRENGELVQNETILKRKVVPPVFFKKIDGEMKAVELRFNSPARVFKTVLLSLTVLFLPVILALFLNGFDFSKLQLGGSAVWFCIVVPTLPVYILKFAIEELYDRPWIYVIQEDGRRKRYRKKREPIGIDWHMVLRALFVPPYCLGTWFAIISFITMVYLTAGYGW